MRLPFKPSQPDFRHLHRTLKRERNNRPVLFEFIVNRKFLQMAAGRADQPEICSLDDYQMIIRGFRNLGYDYAPVYTVGSDIFSFEKGEKAALASVSQNQGALITDRASFEKYNWKDPRRASFEIYHRLKDHLPDGMKLLGFSNGGILENAIDLVGFETLASLSLLDPELTREIFRNIGERLVDFYAIMSAIDTVGACVVNDDWGFRTQTIFPPEMLEEFVFPYTGRIVEAIHASGKPAILHSCGNLKAVMDTVIDRLGVDGKHSFEDAICPVEKAWQWWHDRIAIMGGIDMDYLVRKSPREIYDRATRLLELTFDSGGYALGSGNSIPEYVPLENYLAMIRAATDFSG